MRESVYFEWMYVYVCKHSIFLSLIVYKLLLKRNSRFVCKYVRCEYMHGGV